MADLLRRQAIPGAWLALLLMLLSPAGAHGGEAAADWMPLAGHRIDRSRVSPAVAAESLRNLTVQIGIVDAAGLPAPVREFFRSVPIVLDPSLRGVNGQYVSLDGQWVVRARPGSWPQDRAILMHELLHAYQHQVLGMPTPQVGRAFAEARRDGTYPRRFRDEYFLTNAREYFAVIGEIYLAGTSFRAPYDCATVRAAQPAFIDWLASLFGERRCEGASAGRDE